MKTNNSKGKIANTLLLAILFLSLMTFLVTNVFGQTNIALNKTAAASTRPSTNYVAAKAVDGSTSTEWQSKSETNPWIYVDLGSSVSINQVKLTWGTRYATAYYIQTSADASTWTTIKTLTGQNGGTDDNRALTGTGRYIRIYATARSSSNNGIYLKEYAIYGASDTQEPSVPTSLASASVAQTSFTLSWTASTDNVAVTSYDVYKDGTLYTNVTTTSASISSLTCNTAYSMTVKAKDAAGNVSAASSALSVTTSACPDTQAPSAPSDLASSNITTTFFTLSWTASTDNVGVSSYEVYDGTTSIGTTTSTSISVTGLSASTTYTMTVKAKDAAGNVSAASTELNVNTATAGYRYLKVTANGGVTTNDAFIEELEWMVGTTAYPTTKATGATTTITSTVGTASNWKAFDGVKTLSGFWSPAVTTYPYSITIDLGAGVSINPTEIRIAIEWNGRAWSGFVCEGSSDNSAWTTLFTKTGLLTDNWVRDATNSFVFSGGSSDTQAPTVPTGLGSSAITQTSFTLSWSASTDNLGITGYDVYKDGTLYTSVTSTTATISGLTCGTTYAMTVKAKDAAGNVSAASSTSNISTSSCVTDTQAPTVPTGLTSSVVSYNSVSLSWTASTDNVGVSSYDVYTNETFNTNVTATTATVTGLTPATSYAITVKAKDAAGNVSAASSALNVTTTDAPAGSKPTIGAGLDGITDYSNSRWFVDIMKYSRVFGLADAPWNSYTGTFDPTTHYPTQSFGLVVLSGANYTYEQFLYGTYKLSFNGQASISLSSSGSVTVTNVVYNATTNVTTADVNMTSPNDTQIMLIFTNPVNVNNMKMISPGYPANSTQLVINEWVNVLRPFNQFRFMDWLSTNGNPIVTWEDRHTNNLPGKINRNNQEAGCSWEDVCAFANQINKDIWINIPAKADDNYVTQCATFLKNNLNPNINVYVEWSNEVWNWAFTQFNDNLDAANAEVAAGGSTLNNDGQTNQYNWARRRVVKRIYEVSNLFKNVWGASAINTRIRCVVAGQLSYSHGGVNGDLEWFNKTYGAPKNYFWGIANAPYWNDKPLDDDNTSATVSQLLDALEANKNELYDNRAMDVAAATAAYYGLEFMAYEGGPDTFGPNNVQAKSDLNFDPRMKTISADFLNRWFQNGGKQFNWFVIGCGANNWLGQYGTWAMLHWFGDSTTNMKYQGIKQIMNGTTPTITAGLAIPGSYKATQIVGYSNDFASSKIICADPTEVNSDWYFINAPVNGAYDLYITTKGATANSKATIKVNNVTIGNLTLAINGSAYVSSSSLALPLTAGLNTIQISYTGVDRNVGCLNIQDIVFGSPKNALSYNNSTFNSSISVYPNPANNVLNLSIESVCNSKANINLIDISGKVVFAFNKEITEGSNIVSLNTDNLQNGLYILKVKNGTTIYNEKVLIQK